MLCLKPHNDLAVLIVGQYSGNRFLPLQQILRRMYEHDLEYTVIQLDIFPRNAFKATDRIGICNHAEHKFAVLGKFFAVNAKMTALPGAHPLHTLEHISDMTQRIFQILRCLVGYIGKQSKCCHIDKIAVIKPSDIACKRLALHDQLRSLLHRLRDTNAVRKIIRTASRDIADRLLFPAVHQTGHDFI